MEHGKTIEEVLKYWQDQKANILLPTRKLEELSPWHKPVVEIVALSPNVDDGDVYIQKSGGGKKTKYAITKQGLLKLSTVAGVMFHPHECRRLDDRKDRDYVAYQSVGGLRKPDGTPIFFKAEYDIDFSVLQDEIEYQYEEKAETWNKGGENGEEYGWWRKKTSEQKKAYLSSCIKRDVLQKRKHRLKLAEAGATNRLIRAILNLKNTYTKDELERPFVVIRIALVPDYSDPQIRKAMIEASIRSITNVFGPTPLSLPETTGPAAEVFEVPPGDANGDMPGAVAEDKPIPNENGELPLEDAADEFVLQACNADPNASTRADFMNADADDQLATLKELMKRKGYAEDKLKRDLSKFSAENRRGFFELLIGMQDLTSDKPY